MRRLDLIYSRHNLGERAPKILPSNIPYDELTVVIKGELEYTVNGKAVTLGSGDIIYVSKGDARVRKETEENVDYISFNFSCEERFDIPPMFKNGVHSEVLLLIAAYDKINARAYLDNKEKNQHILGCLLSVIEDRARTENFNPLTLKIMKYIHSNLDKRITLEDIGRLTFFSPVYCDTVFKRETGRSIIDYVLDKRIEEAKKLLLDESLSFGRIAELVGFGDYNYFSRTFKKRSGYAPSEYRRMVNRLN